MDILRSVDAVAVGGLLVLAALFGMVFIFIRNHRVATLRDRYVQDHVWPRMPPGLPGTAEEEDAAAFRFRPLSVDRRQAFVADWIRIHRKFAHAPARAVFEADVLLSDVMVARGYPVSELRRGDEKLSRDLGEVAEYYCAAHAIARSSAGACGEELCRAMVHYRMLFDDLVTEPDDFRPVIRHSDGRHHDVRKETTRKG